jgi:magnesium chelatase family protein
MSGSGFGQVATVAFSGIEAKRVDVQVQISGGRHSFTVVGLPDKAVGESRERVRGALHALGLGLPFRHITCNLAPADLPKEGSHFDLAIALALMMAMGAVSPDMLDSYCVIGELGLDGSILHVPGALPAAIGANAMGKGLICPHSSGPEAAWASEDVSVLAAPHILSLVNHFKGTQILARPLPAMQDEDGPIPDLADIKGQESAKRALEVAAAGGHNLLMIGPPGSGKTMLASRLPSILPPLSPEEMLEVSQIASIAGELAGGRIGRRRPFRCPHHSASMAALIGGGLRARPGEVSLAHLGVLFLDELPEFHPAVLDSLRQPLEAGETVIARANHRVTYPSRVQLIAAMNPCRCGHASEAGRSCKRGPMCREQYQSRVSGPLLDRIDLQIEVPAVSAADLSLPSASETSADVRARVIAARQRQQARLAELAAASGGGPAGGAGRTRGPRTNAETSGILLEKIAALDASGMALLRDAASTLGLSARGYHRALKVARTLADLDGQEAVGRLHVAEALSYRGETLRQRQAA